jgi:hypothetical protein
MAADEANGLGELTMRTYVDDTERIGELIVQVFADDTGATSPREWDNLAAIHGSHDRYEIGDGEPPAEHMRALERGGLVMLYRYMRRYGDTSTEGNPALVAFRKLCMLDHSGVTYWTAELGTSSRHWSDSAGWDSGAVGYAYINRARWDAMMGADTDMSTAVEAIDGEVKEYADWASGNVWAYRVLKPCDHTDEHDSDEERADCPHAEEVDSCYGFIGDPSYAWEVARAAARPVPA